jgi:hypothetical protein
MSWYYLEKKFYDYADDIEAVNIHYVWTPLGGTPDWENQRATRFMPFVRTTSLRVAGAESNAPSPGTADPTNTRLRKKILKLPTQITDPENNGELTDSYLLHHYFEVFQDGHRHYSPLYTEEVTTGAGAQPLSDETVDEVDSSLSLEAGQAVTTAQASAKEVHK